MRASLIATFMMVAVAGSAAAGTGDLDPTFGTGGAVLTSIGYGAPSAAVLRQSTGKIVAVGTVSSTLGSSGDVALLRFDAAGTLDGTFGVGGVVTEDFAPRYAYVQGAALQPDDSIVVVAVGSDVSYALSNASLLVVRFDADGVPDASFGTGGHVVVPNVGLWMRDVIIQPDGSIVLAGEQTLRFAAVRLEADGDLDPTFGTGGIASTGICCGAAAFAPLPGGELLLAGTNQQDAIVMLLDGTGTVDTTFGTGGMTTFEFVASSTDAANAIAVLGDGRIVAAGRSFFAGQYGVSHHGVARLTAAGALDPTFGAGGVVAPLVGFHGFMGDGPVALAIEPSGKLLVLGTGTFGPPFLRQLELLRFEPDGAFDRSFGASGRTFTRLLDATHAGSMLIQPDGRVVVAGAAAAPGALFSDFSWAVARYDTACPSLPDTDNDGIGDACDPCTGGPTPQHTVLRFVKIAPPTGDDRLVLSVRGQLPPGAPIDPQTDGLRLAVEDATGAALFDTTIPPGPVDPTLGVGWSMTGTHARYRNGPAVIRRVEGISAATLRQSADGGVRLTIKGKDGSYPFSGATLPLRARVVLSPPRGSSGLCFETDFADGDGCTLANGRISCRQ